MAELQRKVPVASSPTYLSGVRNEGGLETFERGSAMLGFTPTPQGRIIASVLEAKDADGLPLYPEVAGLVPRRAAKTTSVWSTVLGRCAEIPGYTVATTAQDGKRASNILLSIGRILEEREGHADVAGSVRRVLRGKGSEAIEFANGSRIWSVPPKASAFRSEAADLLLFDEAGEYDMATTEDILEGALPLTDTRPLGQAVIMGTPAKVRAGLLWDTLQDGRRGKPGTGIFDWSIRDEEEWFTYVDEAAPGAIAKNREWIVVDEDVIRRVHPGIGTLTTWTKIMQRLDKLSVPSFEKEYLCRFPFDSSVGAIDMAAWSAAQVDEERLPERFGLAYDVAPDGSSAAVCAAWRDDEGVARIAVMEHRQGVSWVVSAISQMVGRYKVPVRFDSIGANHAVSAELGRRRAVTLRAGRAREAQGAAQVLTSNLTDGLLRHFGHSSLTAAAEGAAWRQSEGGRYFGRKASANDISPLVAASLALWEFDSTPRSRGPAVVPRRRVTTA